MPRGIYKRKEENRKYLFKKGENGFKGRKHTEETKRKMSKKHKGKKMSDEARKKMSEMRVGLKFSEEHRRKLSESHKGLKHSEKTKRKMKKNNWRAGRGGEEHPNWRGGISFEPYTTDWTRTFRRGIRERDKYICQLCGKQQEDRAFSIHHIDYNKENCNPDNLITLCISCHAKTNHNRKKWIKILTQ